jgi:hypothetical protein
MKPFDVRLKDPHVAGGGDLQVTRMVAPRQTCRDVGIGSLMIGVEHGGLSLDYLSMGKVLRALASAQGVDYQRRICRPISHTRRPMLMAGQQALLHS